MLRMFVLNIPVVEHNVWVETSLPQPAMHNSDDRVTVSADCFLHSPICISSCDCNAHMPFMVWWLKKELFLTFWTSTIGWREGRSGNQEEMFVQVYLAKKRLDSSVLSCCLSVEQLPVCAAQNSWCAFQNMHGLFCMCTHFCAYHWLEVTINPTCLELRKICVSM